MNHSQLNMYQQCWFIRAFEGAIAAEAAAGNVPGLVHLSTGSEVADVLIGHHIDRDLDKVTGSHRSHGLALACGAEPLDVAKEILGKAGGLSDGLGGTQHLIAPESGFLTSNGIVGAQVPLAAGAALSAKSRRDGGIGVAVFGDGAANQGAVLETMNLVAALKLPMLFVLYNNGMAQSTKAETASCGDYRDRARSFGLPVWSADSVDFVACFEAVEHSVAHARCSGPAFVEIAVSRDHGHYYGDEKTDQAFDASDALLAFEKALLEQEVERQAVIAAADAGRTHARAVVTEAVAASNAPAILLADWSSGEGVIDG